MRSFWDRISTRWVHWLLLVVILAAGAYLRTVGMDWDAEQHLHPDERFLTMVEASLLPVSSVGEFFDTNNSTLNPANQGHSFFVYGTLPIFLVRYLAEATGANGYGNIYLVGRALSASVDFLNILVVFLIGSYLLDRRAGLLAAAFFAFAVLPIQQSHFFTVDTFITFFSVLAVYFAIEVASGDIEDVKLSSFILFGVALGMAVASKINAAPVAITLPLSVLVLGIETSSDRFKQAAPKLFLYLVIAAFVSLITFRISQPYAFQGPGFFNIRLDENWITTLKTLQGQTSGDVDFPPALQWARRPVWFSLKNMVLWGLGVPLGVAAWTGFIWMGIQIFNKNTWKPHFVIWGWTAIYFIWQSMQWNSTMRYQLPIYPLLSVFAGWFFVTIWDQSVTGWNFQRLDLGIARRTARVIVGVMGALCLLLTAAWGFAFTRIYTVPHPRVAASEWIFQNIPGSVTLILETKEGPYQQLLSYPDTKMIQKDESWQISFIPHRSGTLKQITLPEIQGNSGLDDQIQFLISITDQDGRRLVEIEKTIPLSSHAAVDIPLQEHIPFEEDQQYNYQMEVYDPGAVISLRGARIANESSWDDGLPLRISGYDPFGGIYSGGLNFEMYWDDNPEKLDRFLTTLDQADFLLITSSRQWASTTRVPERYPLTTKYYQELMGCPVELGVEHCYNIAQPGMYEGNLGFDLVQVFQSTPQLGPIKINDQFAEEAFTVYDHPKVFIFQKTDHFKLSEVAGILSEVDLERVIHLTPKQADGHPGTLLLPNNRLQNQQDGGTWSQLFDSDSILNRSQIAGTVVWYLSVFLLGLIVTPLMNQVLAGLSDGGYPLARTFGMLLLSYLVWLAGSVQIPFTQLTISVVILMLAVVGGFVAYRNWQPLVRQWKQNKQYFLFVEVLALGIFVIGLLIRFGNPDLWHPWKGGEKPMDFSYFNAVLKSTSFPPYDPWFAGGYINYYYYGFVFVGVLVKFLGIVPAFSYNLILPTLLMMIGLGVFSTTWNLFRGWSKKNGDHQRLAYLAGTSGVLGMIALGNLGIIRMTLQGLQRLASGGLELDGVGFFQKFIWTFVGLERFIGSRSLGYRIDEWYWNPSRVIGAEHGGPITEFPFFTFLYGDLHAHFIVLPLTLLVIAWIVSLSRSSVKPNRPASSFLYLLGLSAFGGLAVGALRPTNTWDFYPYLALGIAAIIHYWWNSYRNEPSFPWLQAISQLSLFVLFSFLFFRPYSEWYGQGYTNVKGWFGTRTPWSDYFVHWGLFLFVIGSWMASETIHWMANTPVSALRKLKEHREIIIACLLLLLVVMISQGVYLEEGLLVGTVKLIGAGVHTIWFILPMMVWAGILLLRPGTPIGKQVVLFLTGTALAITLMVELVYIEGDIGRMNTVFKFYLQAWTMFAISSAAAVGWLVISFSSWPGGLKKIWQTVFSILLVGAALYPILGGFAKIQDRMAPEAPRSLDGMVFMDYATYADLQTEMDLSQDYRAIRWMQENVVGSPVIVEANQVEYHWGTRYTIYTGLPGVIGWNWHQRQQRTIVPHEWVFERVDDVNQFYDATDLSFVRDFLRRYQVQYIILGQLERAKYNPAGLEKFSAAEGVLWKAVYQDGDTIIYQVIPELGF